MELEIIDILFLPAIFIIGLIASWQDYQFGIVKNKWIKIGFLYGIFIFLFFILKGAFAPHFLYSIGLDVKIPFIYYAKVYINTSFAIIIGFYLWKKGLLAAGDAKLFILIAFLLPLKYYWKSYLPYFPAFSLLLNISIPLFAVIFYNALHDWFYKSLDYLKNYKKIDINKLKTKFNSGLLIYIKTSAGFGTTFLILTFFLDNWFPITLVNSSYLFLFTMFAREQIYSYFKRQKLLAWLFFFALSIIIINFFKIGFLNTTFWMLNTLRMVAIFNTLFLIMNIVINNYVEKNKIKIKIKDLRPGIMVILNKMPKPKIGDIMGGGISKKQVKLLKEWGKVNGYKEIEAFKNLPFAIWIFIGALITIIYNKSIIIMIFELF